MVSYNLKFNLRLSRKLAKKFFQKRTTKEQYNNSYPRVSKLKSSLNTDLKYYVVVILMCLYFFFVWALENWSLTKTSESIFLAFWNNFFLWKKCFQKGCWKSDWVMDKRVRRSYRLSVLTQCDGISSFMVHSDLLGRILQSDTANQESVKALCWFKLVCKVSSHKKQLLSHFNKQKHYIFLCMLSMVLRKSENNKFWNHTRVYISMQCNS